MSHEFSRRSWLLILPGVLLAGCQRSLETHFPEPKSAVVYRDIVPGKTYDTGRLIGVVEWVGEKPTAEPIRGLIDTKDGVVWGEVENPFLPKIDKDMHVKDVVIQVLNPPAEIAHEWPHRDEVQWQLMQEGFDNSIQHFPLFFKVGQELTIEGDEKYSQLRARGASFWTKSFKNADSEHKVRLDQPGCVELSRTNGQFWRVAHVWVCDHPYFTKSNEKGQCDLGKLPPGEYDIQASIPNWQITGRDRDPETGRIMQLHRGPDITVTQRVKVEAGKETRITLKLSSPVVPPPAAPRAP